MMSKANHQQAQRPRDIPASGAQRAAKYKASGRQIACVIRDPSALAALDELERSHGGVTAAVTFALRSAASSIGGAVN